MVERCGHQCGCGFRGGYRMSVWVGWLAVSKGCGDGVGSEVICVSMIAVK